MGPNTDKLDVPCPDTGDVAEAASSTKGDQHVSLSVQSDFLPDAVRCMEIGKYL